MSLRYSYIIYFVLDHPSFFAKYGIKIFMLPSLKNNNVRTDSYMSDTYPVQLPSSEVHHQYHTTHHTAHLHPTAAAAALSQCSNYQLMSNINDSFIHIIPSQ